MYTYKRRGKIGPGSIFFIVLFTTITIGLGYLLYLDKGKFWDLLPLVSIPIIAISLILTIFNFLKRTGGGYIFLLFFIIFLAGIILSSIFGPFAVYREAQKNYENKHYQNSIDKFKIILESYSNSRYADDALRNISHAYYLNGNYDKALNYFKKSMEQNVISSSDLEIKKILADCYSKLGDSYYNEKKYTKSAENYLNAAKVLDEIKLNFPGTNEAFIATYKIPEYLFKTALSYKHNKNWDETIEILKNITFNYPESEYFSNANEELFNAYIYKSIELKNDHNYREAVEEFLKVLDLEKKYTSHYILNYYRKELFSNILPSILKNIAKDIFYRHEYKKALFVYEAIIDYNPELKEEIEPFIVDCKINIIATSNYVEITQTEPVKKIYSRGESFLVIENTTNYDLTIYFSGPEHKIVEIEPEKKIEIDIKPGTYKIAAELIDSNILPFYGIVAYQEGQKYKEVYSISSQ